MGEVVWLLWSPIILLAIYSLVRNRPVRNPYKNKEDPYKYTWGNDWNVRLQSYELDNESNIPDYLRYLGVDPVLPTEWPVVDKPREWD